MKCVLGVLTCLLLAGCTTAEPPQAAPAAPAVHVAPALAKRAATLGTAACTSWGRQSTATDLAGVRALRVAAERSAAAAAALDPRWKPLAQDLTELKTLEAEYAKADVYAAFPLVPKLEGLRKRIPTRC